MGNAVRYGFAFLIPLTVTAAMTPTIARLARRVGAVDDRERQHRTPHAGTPNLGGIAVALGLAAVGLSVAGASGQLTVVVIGAAVVAGMGFVDDRRGVGPITKVMVEVGAALALWFAGIGAGLFGNPVLDAMLSVVWVVSVTNALNLVDNMDGLAAGLAALSAFAFFVIAASEGDYLVSSLALATGGAALGFLWHNFPPAKIFLGDAGSLLLGFLLAALGLKLDLVGESGLARSAIPILILAVPLFDMGLVIVARLRDGRRVFLGGTDHSSHRLLGMGLSTRSVALASYTVQAVCCGLAVTLTRSGWTAVAVACLALATIALVALALLLRATPQTPVAIRVERPEARRP